jgi:HD-GYP domain-containing protein (c-di-GMP phosphodiesterase class II)
MISHKKRTKALLLNECLEVLGLALEYNLKDFPLHQHVIRVGEGCVLLGAKMGFDRLKIRNLYFAGLLHDVGKISIPLGILNKKESLTEEEFTIVKNHTVQGSRIICSLPELDRLAFGVRWHHERWDGTGYPDGLAKHEIPIEIQILSAVDCFDSLQTPRMDRDAHTPGEAFEIMRENSGSHFNPDIIDLIFELHSEKILVPGQSSRQFLEIKDKYLTAPLAEKENDYAMYRGITGLYPVLRLFARVIDAKHHYTSGHSTRVSVLSKYIAEQMGFPADDLMKIEIAGLMHDAGKISIPNELLEKKGIPTEEEWRCIRRHPVHSSELIKTISLFDEIANIAYYHHVWADGHGYPETRPEDPGPVLSQIIALADAYDAITSERAYSKAETPESAYRIIREGLGTQFNHTAGKTLINTSPKYIKALFDMHEE